MKVVWVNLEVETESLTGAGGAEIELIGLPPYSRQTLQSQLLTGLRPEQTGIFDELSLEGYQVVPSTAMRAASEKGAWHLVQRLKQRTDLTTPELIYLSGNQIDELERVAGEDDFKIITMPHLTHQVKRVNVNRFLEQKGIIKRDETGQVEWEDTLAYYIGHGQVWINLLGREPQGIVTPGAEYQEVCEALIKVLKQMIDPVSQEKIIANVWKKPELYITESPYFIQAPDLILTFRPGYAPSSQSRWLGFEEIEQEEPVWYPGSHKMFLWGPGIKPGYQTHGNLIDVVPTLLFLLGLPLPEQELDGRILDNIFEAHLIQSRTPIPGPKSQLTVAEEKLLIDRLEALGYIE
jgi:predicted AlkP superfamily phosphohydrolase/phosphomutase